eukprot:gnl/MRDRNA2_/MRDRNA2_221672_c0_seq1.p1 gnl/MRDRNA2_/MRDRNA2_221672_c0~~gnl/MRDRNA2_/MRDRNA2_221672_c0_seq1.p1  ORF type:complete len:253 (-),score=30.26 gnl/MRDRNA2_/MRDRNA2_221672_c0_seq1:259-912(-)
MANVYIRLNLLALSAALSWLNLVRYIACRQYWTPAYMLWRTLAVGAPKVMQFLIGVLPLFMAYTVMGVGLWGFDTPWFSSLSMSAATLFALLNGDTLLDTYRNLRGTNWPMAQLYLYSFLILFMYVVLNICITIIEDAYFNQGKVPHQEYAQQSQPQSSDGSLHLLEGMHHSVQNEHKLQLVKIKTLVHDLEIAVEHGQSVEVNALFAKLKAALQRD